MKEKITKFDLDAAFKALDEIEIPKVNGIRANRQNFSESLKKVDKLELLMEDYYDVNDHKALEEAQDEREEEIAQAKLDRIEKIVDLDADSPEDILPSYVGKTIIQCPQCMTLFYKAPEDIEASAENPDVVNVSETCQHCGNKTGYNVIGKVAPEDNAELEEPLADNSTEAPVEELPVEEPAPEDLAVEESPEKNELERSDVEEQSEETEESLEKESSSSLLEQIENALTESDDKELNKKLDEHNAYIEYLQAEIKKNEENLKNAKNEFIKDAIQRCLDALQADLDAAIPDEVKNSSEEPTIKDQNDADAPVEVEEVSNTAEVEPIATSDSEGSEDKKEVESLHEDAKSDLNAFVAGLEDDPELGEDLATDKKLDACVDSVVEKEDPVEENLEEAKNDVTEAEFDSMINSPVFYEELEEPADEEDYDDTVDEIVDESINTHFTNFLTEVYSNVKSFNATNCEMINDKLIIEGCIKFKSGKTKNTTFTFTKNNNKYTGLNESLSVDSKFELDYSVNDRIMTIENLTYSYSIDKNLVEGCTRK